MTDKDETACDHCGQPTPRLDPPAAVELCDTCHVQQEALQAHFGAELREQAQRDQNDAIVTRYLRAKV